MEQIISEQDSIKRGVFLNLTDETFISQSYDFLQGIQYYEKVHYNFEDTNSIYLYDTRLFVVKEIYEHLLEESRKDDEEKERDRNDNILTNNALESDKRKAVKRHSKSEFTFMVDLIKQTEKNNQAEKNEKKFLEDLYEVVLEHEKNAALNEIFKILNSNPKLKKIYFLRSNNKTKELYYNLQERVYNEFLDHINSNEGFKENKVGNLKVYIKPGTTGGLICKFNQEIKCDLLNFLKLIYSVEYYPKWFPFVEISQCQSYPGLTQLVNYMTNKVPIISDRDFLIYGFGINNIHIDKTIFILVKSLDMIEDQFFQELVNSTKSTKYVRGFIECFGWKVTVIDKEHLKINSVISVNPKIDFIPQSLMNIFLNKLAVDLFTKIMDVLKDYEQSDIYNRHPNTAQQAAFDLIETAYYSAFGNK